MATESPLIQLPLDSTLRFLEDPASEPALLHVKNWLEGCIYKVPIQGIAVGRVEPCFTQNSSEIWEAALDIHYTDSRFLEDGIKVVRSIPVSVGQRLSEILDMRSNATEKAVLHLSDFVHEGYTTAQDTDATMYGMYGTLLGTILYGDFEAIADTLVVHVLSRRANP